jgi:hypothetical protein
MVPRLNPNSEVGEHARLGRRWVRLASSGLRVTLARTFETFLCAPVFHGVRGKLHPGRVHSHFYFGIWVKPMFARRFFSLAFKHFGFV